MTLVAGAFGNLIHFGNLIQGKTLYQQIIGGMSHMKDSVQRRAWSDIRRGVFTPEPLTDVDEHWIEVTENSEMMCDLCKSFQQGAPTLRIAQDV